MVITAVVKRADPKTTNGVVYPPTCIENIDKKITYPLFIYRFLIIQFNNSRV